MGSETKMAIHQEKREKRREIRGTERGWLNKAPFSTTSEERRPKAAGAIGESSSLMQKAPEEFFTEGSNRSGK